MSDARHLEGLTPEQQQAVLHKEGPLLIIAGAGSGKTRTVTRRIAYLISGGVPASQILAITFTNKAAGEMRERVDDLLGGPARGGGRRRAQDDPSKPTVSTFHAFAVRVLRRYADRLGFGRDFTILDSADQTALVREAAVSARVDVQRHQPARLLHVIGRAKERLDDGAFFASARSDLERAAAEVLPRYRELQRRRNALDFDDLVASAVHLLDRHPDVHAELLERIRYVMVDEYQDTNHAQYRLAYLLAGPRQNLAVCGDPDQSIYAFRGADMRNILRFEEDFPTARVVRLERNYRSTATILRAANTLIQHNAERKDKQLLPTGEEGGLLEVRRLLDERLEAEFVARGIEDSLGAGVAPGQIAVIYRAAIHAKLYEESLLRRGIACQTSGTFSFFERTEIKDAMAFIKLAVNPRDDLSALRALRLHAKGVGKRTLEKIHDFQRRTGASVLDGCARAGELDGITGPKRAQLEGFAAAARALEAEGRRSVERLVVSAIERTGFEATASQDPQAQRRLANLRMLLDAAKRTDRKSGPQADRAQAFLDKLQLLDAQDHGDGERDRVTLTTAHASKGLEFDVVFVVGLEQGLFPHRRSLEEGNLEEERRLAYVAFTRARKRLVLTYAAHRAARTMLEQRRRPSMFLYELPSELLYDAFRKEPFELEELEPAPVLPDPSAQGPGRAAARRRGRAAPNLLAAPGARKGLIGVPQAPSPSEAPPLWAKPLLRSR